MFGLFFPFSVWFCALAENKSSLQFKSGGTCLAEGLLIVLVRRSVTSIEAAQPAGLHTLRLGQVLLQTYFIPLVFHEKQIGVRGI